MIEGMDDPTVKSRETERQRERERRNLRTEFEFNFKLEQFLISRYALGKGINPLVLRLYVNN